MEEESQEQQTWQFARLILKVLYNPTRAFEEIIKRPMIKGPILILIITLPLILAGQYISGTKFFLENPIPDEDLWTEKPLNSASFLWTSNDNITFDDGDYISGNYSVSSSLINTSTIWLRLTDIGRINCGTEEFNRLSFKIKWIIEGNAIPTAILQLFSHDENRRFESNITHIIANSSGIWENVTVSLATNNTNTWIPTSNQPSWDNITGVEFQLFYDGNTNLTIRIDDLFFGKFIPISSSATFDIQILYLLLRSSADHLFEWLILSGLVLLALKSFTDWKGVWKEIFFTIGYVYSAFILNFAALVVLFSVLPALFIPYRITYLEYLDLYQGSWGTPISVVTLLFYGWIMILCTIGVKKMQEMSWSKALLIGFGAILISLVFSSLLLSMFF
ncbi:MAG: hypothetical protein JSV05_09720 [Candidatus Bathyarchaeota archaeon]|nr:MAG: hypothetical protein JSV05_09720 [Candidatus Bathyarchaeota archaeon]